MHLLDGNVRKRSRPGQGEPGAARHRSRFEIQISNRLEEMAMAYNHRRAEREWRKWKDTEEKQLRELGVDEDTIQRLHTYDWRQFKAERNFYEWQTVMSEALEWTLQMESHELKNADDLLSNIENKELLAILEKVDKLTLEMLAMQMLGYSTPQICRRFNVTAYSYYNRIKRLKEKLKNFFKSD